MSRTRPCYGPALYAIALAAATAPAAFGTGVTIFEDNFESYADTAAMAAVWAGGPGTLNNTITGANVNSINHPGGAVNNHVVNPTSIVPSDATPIVWQFDFYWDGLGNKRISGGLRNSGGNGILEMGYYNAAVNPVTSATGSGFAYRTVLMPGSTNWILFMKPDNSGPLDILTTASNAWSTFQATIKGTSVDFKVDIGRDGTWDGTASVSAVSDGSSTGPSVVYNDVRFGGPSGISSGGGGADFDNVSIKTAPTAPPHTPGDVNGDGFVNSGDINAFIYALSNDATGFAAQYPTGIYMNADVNEASHVGDGFVNAADINPFIAILSGTGEPGIDAALAAVPEPASLSLLAAPALALLRRRRP